MKLELVLDEVELPWVPAAETLRRADFVVASAGPSDAQLQVVLTDDATLQEHNRDYRGIDRPTDVLSFSYLEGHEAHREGLLRGDASFEDHLDGPHPDDEVPLLGQVLVSLQTLHARGPVHATGLDDECLFMIVHGLLHVLGFDHADAASAREMEARERELMSRSDAGAQGDAPSTGGEGVRS